MNSLWLILIGIICLAMGYLLYGRFLARLWQVNPQEITPAQSKNDGIDYSEQVTVAVRYPIPSITFSASPAAVVLG